MRWWERWHGFDNYWDKHTMGMFSFLTGKKEDEAGAVTTGAQAEPAASPPVATPTASEARAASKVATPPHSSTPFTAPDAWSPEAMKTPKPESSPKPSADASSDSGAGSAKETLEFGPLDPEQTAALQGKIVEVIKTVFDPEIPVDIYELGLIYEIIVDADRNALINMTLTSPACPSAQQIPAEVRFKVKSLPEIEDAKVEVVWEPAWTKDRMSEAAKLTLGFF